VLDKWAAFWISFVISWTGIAGSVAARAQTELGACLMLLGLHYVFWRSRWEDLYSRVYNPMHVRPRALLLLLGATLVIAGILAAAGLGTMS